MLSELCKRLALLPSMAHADAALLATAPALAEVHAPGSESEWRAELRRLCPGATADDRGLA